MDRNSAIRLIKETFENTFDKERFKHFTRNLLNHMEESSFTYRGAYIPDAYKSHFSTLERIGKYKDPEGNKIDLLITHLKKETTLERARATQRNFVGWYLKGSRGGDLKDAALVAFVSPTEEDWRFSLVKMDYKLVETESGLAKAKEEFTPARRFSFLVGKNETSHTAQSRLVPILQDDTHDPTLKWIEEAFSIEKVTKEFFGKYRELFLRAKEALDKILEKDNAIKKDFAQKDVNTVDFTKKLLGQIVFLYFLQKKGWFGVQRDKKWGTGSKRFLRDLFDRKIIEYKNFFNDVIEPLFYDALARDRSDVDHLNPLFKCKIPFLNGGLFDPINNYDWAYTDILLPDELFSNIIKTKEGDIGNGILDTFDRYNFTVKEDEPLEKEVAVDPEMLGKVFENLLEVKDRKSKGTYYTPREIVYYMCQESLINYLVTELNGEIIREDFEILVKYGAAIRENELAAVEKERTIEAGEQRGTKITAKLPPSVIRNAFEIDTAIKNIRVCDPAVGSCAFLVGMMSEIINVRDALTPHIKEKAGRIKYDFKRHAIRNCLYGVDVDPGAVEIAKLRLWLSLVVEEDIKSIKPLPNLDYKIMQGNSLLEEYEGIKLIDEQFFQKPVDVTKEIEAVKNKQSAFQKEYFELHSKNKLTPLKKAELQRRLDEIDKQLRSYNNSSTSDQGTLGIFKPSESQQKATKLLKKMSQFFELVQKKEKDKLKNEIEELTWKLIEATLKENKNNEKLREIIQFRRKNVKPFFLWKLHFAEVFHEKDGFDVVIANPPYVSMKKFPKDTHSRRYKDCLLESYETFASKSDLYCCFFEKSLGTNSVQSTLRENGILIFICSSTFFCEPSFQKLRELMLDNQILLLSVPRADVFESSLVNTAVISIKKTKDRNNIIELYEVDKDRKISKTGFIEQGALRKLGLFLKNNNELVVSILEKSGLLSHQNQFLNLESVLTINNGIATADNDLWLYEKNNFISEESWLMNKEFHNKRNVKDFYRGETVRRWFISEPNSKINYLPDLMKEHRSTARPKTPDFFETRKLVSQLVGEELRVAFDDVGRYFDINVNLIYPKTDSYHITFILSLLNSELINFIVNSLRSNISITLTLLYKIPIPARISSHEQKPFIGLVDRILAITKDEDYSQNPQKRAKVKMLERKIDQLVYKLYGLTKEEIAIVENE